MSISSGIYTGFRDYFVALACEAFCCSSGLVAVSISNQWPSKARTLPQIISNFLVLPTALVKDNTTSKMAAPNAKPTIVFVPGGWHTPAAWENVATLLSHKSFPTSIISLPSVGADPPIQDFSRDVEVIEGTVRELLDAGKDVVLVMHSYGGCPGSEAMGNLLADNDYAGKKGKGSEAMGNSLVDKSGVSKDGKGTLLRMVWICSFVPVRGTSLVAAIGGRDLPWWNVKDDIVLPENAAFYFYSDLDPTAAEHWVSRLRPHSYRTFHSIVAHEPFLEIGTSYLMCVNDNAIPLTAQEGMVADARAKSNGMAFDHVERCASGHSPFLSMPNFVVQFLERAMSFVGET